MSAYAIQAGREVRVVVDAEKVNDDLAVKVCRDIAKAVEAESDVSRRGQGDPHSREASHRVRSITKEAFTAEITESTEDGKNRVTTESTARTTDRASGGMDEQSPAPPASALSFFGPFSLLLSVAKISPFSALSAISAVNAVVSFALQENVWIFVLC